MRMQGPQVYQTRFGPTYRVSYSVSIGLLTTTVATICVTWFLVDREDKRRLTASVEATDEEQLGIDTTTGTESQSKAEER